MVLRPAWCCVVVGVVVVAKLTEAQFVSAAAFLVGRNLVMPGVPHVTPTGRPMIVAAPTPTQPRRGGTYFFSKKHVQFCSPNLALFTRERADLRKITFSKKLCALRARRDWILSRKYPMCQGVLSMGAWGHWVC